MKTKAETPATLSGTSRASIPTLFSPQATPKNNNGQVTEPEQRSFFPVAKCCSPKWTIAKFRSANYSELYEDRDTDFPSQKCQCECQCEPQGSCTREIALFQISYHTGPPLTCPRMRWKVSHDYYIYCFMSCLNPFCMWRIDTARSRK